MVKKIKQGKFQELVGVRAGRSSTASDLRARGRNLQHRSDYSKVVLSCEEVTTGLCLGVE